MRGSAKIRAASLCMFGFAAILIQFKTPEMPCADEIVVEAGSDTEVMTDQSGEAYSEDIQLSQEAPAQNDMAGLFEDTGQETVSRKGETLEEARSEDEALYGSGDGGSTVNIGHLYRINGVNVRNSDFPSEHYQCWTYANNMYAKIWGHNFLNVFNDSENMLRNLPDEELTLTPEHLKAYVSAASAGAVLRICDAPYLHADDGWGHSQIIISHDENGFTVFEGGLAQWPHRREAYYTWNGYCYSGWPGKYHYIKYIKWPGAGVWSGGSSGAGSGFVADAEDLGVSEMDELCASLRESILDIADLITGLARGEVRTDVIERMEEALERAA